MINDTKNKTYIFTFKNNTNMIAIDNIKELTPAIILDKRFTLFLFILKSYFLTINLKEFWRPKRSLFIGIKYVTKYTTKKVIKSIPI